MTHHEKAEEQVVEGVVGNRADADIGQGLPVRNGVIPGLGEAHPVHLADLPGGGRWVGSASRVRNVPFFFADRVATTPGS